MYVYSNNDDSCIADTFSVVKIAFGKRLVTWDFHFETTCCYPGPNNTLISTFSIDNSNIECNMMAYKTISSIIFNKLLNKCLLFCVFASGAIFVCHYSMVNHMNMYC